MIIGVDGGKDGGICIDGDYAIPMPIKYEVTKPKIDEVLTKKVKGKNVPLLIKSGENKGKIKTRKKFNESKEYSIDIKRVIELFTCESKPSAVVLEKAGLSHSSSSLRVQTANIEAIRIATRILDIRLVEVSASRWKDYFKLPSEKEPCVDFANDITGHSYTYKQDGLAESFLIWKWWSDFNNDVSLSIGEKFNYNPTKKNSMAVTLIEVLPNCMAKIKTKDNLKYEVRIEDLFFKKEN